MMSSAFSIVEILRVLYDDILRVDPAHPPGELRIDLDDGTAVARLRFTGEAAALVPLPLRSPWRIRSTRTRVRRASEYVRRPTRSRSSPTGCARSSPAPAPRSSRCAAWATC